MRRLMLDTMIFSTIASSEDYLAAIVDAQKAMEIEIVTTHIQRDQLTATPDEGLRLKLLTAYESIAPRSEPTYGVVLDVSRWDEARFGDAESLEQIVRNAAWNPSNISDALIALTADYEVDVYVSDDGSHVKRFQKERRRCKVWSGEQFRKYVFDLAKTRAGDA